MPGNTGIRSPAQSAPNPLRIPVRAGGTEKSPGTVFVQKAEEDEGAEERAGSCSSLSSRVPGSWQGTTFPIANIRCKRAGAAQRFHFGACRHPSPGCSSPAGCERLGLACCLAEKRFFCA